MLKKLIFVEQNAVIQAAKNGILIDGSTIYITAQPCIICAKILIASGIKRIVFKGDYPDELSLEMLKESNIEVAKL